MQEHRRDSTWNLWAVAWMKRNNVLLWNIADLSAFETPSDASGNGFPRAFSWVIPMDPVVMTGIRNGPNRAYAETYARVNSRINALASDLETAVRGLGFGARALPASERTDPVSIKGDFPHKTAATRAGLGWIGRHCQLITRPFGPWVRLGTVFTDLPLECGRPVDKGFCGNCMRCVKACPAQALTGRDWSPGVRRDILLDAAACDRWKKENYFTYHKGHNCGICSSVCPYGVKSASRNAGQRQPMPD